MHFAGGTASCIGIRVVEAAFETGETISLHQIST